MKTISKPRELKQTRENTAKAILKELDSHESVKVVYNHPKAYNYSPDAMTEYYFSDDFLFRRISFDFKRPSYNSRNLKNWIFVCRQINKKFHDPASGNYKDNFQIETEMKGTIDFAKTMLFYPTKNILNYGQ
jgi:hypothetical protein